MNAFSHATSNDRHNNRRLRYTPSTASHLLSKCILDNLTLLEHRITLAGDSGQAAELSVDTRAGHLSGLSAGFDVGE